MVVSNILKLRFSKMPPLFQGNWGCHPFSLSPFQSDQIYQPTRTPCKCLERSSRYHAETWCKTLPNQLVSPCTLQFWHDVESVCKGHAPNHPLSWASWGGATDSLSHVLYTDISHDRYDADTGCKILPNQPIQWLGLRTFQYVWLGLYLPVSPLFLTAFHRNPMWILAWTK